MQQTIEQGITISWEIELSNSNLNSMALRRIFCCWSDLAQGNYREASVENRTLFKVVEPKD